ncbi:MAG: hypothetical protein EA352_11770 [Gemmatimonadales bacterium]|nr:MAG: hypothetical protein EA352_11770 [Gemmatimonadales bacterium]
MPTWSQALLLVHVVGGASALAGALGAMATQAAGLAHHWHRRTGLAFFWGMAILFVTSIPLAVLASSILLLLVALFSFYMAFSGLRHARRRDGRVSTLDRTAAWGMVATGVLMLGLAGFLGLSGDGMWVVLLVFGLLAISLGRADVAVFRDGLPRGRERIAYHLRMMLGGTIAAVTGFVTTNMPTDPGFLAWLLPTVVLVPILVWWSRRVRAVGTAPLFRLSGGDRD